MWIEYRKAFLFERSGIIEISAKVFCSRESQHLRRYNRQKNLFSFNIYFSKICFFLRQDIYFQASFYKHSCVRWQNCKEKSFFMCTSVFFLAGFQHYICFLVVRKKVLSWREIIWILKNLLTYSEFHLFTLKLFGSDKILTHHWINRKYYSSSNIKILHSLPPIWL